MDAPRRGDAPRVEEEGGCAEEEEEWRRRADTPKTVFVERRTNFIFLFLLQWPE